MTPDGTECYEVMIRLRKGGTWTLHGRFEEHERSDAIEEARNLSSEDPARPVKVVRDEYNAATGRSREVVVYRNQAAESEMGASSINYADMVVQNGKAGFLAHEGAARRPQRRGVPSKKKISSLGFSAIIIMTIFIAVMSGLFTSGFAALVLNHTAGTMDADSRMSVLGAVFVIMALLVGSTLGKYYFARFQYVPHKRSKMTRNLSPQSVLDDLKKDLDADLDSPNPNPPPSELPDPVPDSALETLDNPAQTAITPEPEAPAGLTENGLTQRAVFHTFVSKCLEKVRGKTGATVNMDRFGVNLFVTGALSLLGQEKDLVDTDRQLILVDMLKFLGAKEEQVLKFAQTYSEYLKEQRHETLFDAGVEAMDLYLKDDLRATTLLCPSLEAWESWRDDAPLEQHGLLAIMFTDMVGSTDLSTRQGDYAAHQVLNAHNMIVRTALTNHKGKEIKHLGDGIMAAFSSTQDALRAACDIQKRVQGHNDTRPENPLLLRIGINTGEPIMENNDLFGTAVQLAARLCSFSGAGQISVSAMVKGLCEEHGFMFQNRGEQALKGFEHPIHVFGLDWQAAGGAPTPSPVPGPKSEAPVPSDEALDDPVPPANSGLVSGSVNALKLEEF